MIDGMREIRFQDREQGEVLVVMALPRPEDSWGVLAPLRDTAWAELIRTVPGEALSHAMHGYATPLVRALGPDPRKIGRRVPEKVARCSKTQTCASAGPECRVGREVPECYEPPGVDQIASFVAVFLRDGWHVVVVEGSEFSLP